MNGRPGAVLFGDAPPFATTVSGFLTPILLAVIVGLLGWVGSTLLKLSSVVGILVHEVIPEGEPSLKSQVTTVANDVAILKDRGTRNPEGYPDNPR